MPKAPTVIKKTEIRYVKTGSSFRWKRYGGYTLAAAGVALVALGVLDGVAAADIADDLDQLCSTSICQLTLDETQQKVADGDALATRANWFLAGGALALAGGATLIILDAIRTPGKTVFSPELPSKDSNSSTRLIPTPTGLWVQHDVRF